MKIIIFLFYFLNMDFEFFNAAAAVKSIAGPIVI